jgi:hypothetical protein
MLTHVLGRTLKPLTMDWGGVGKLLDFPQAEFVDLNKIPDKKIATAQI